jgi:predicted nuclease with TOPRIM domain
MKKQLTQRLNELTAEYEAGQRMLADLEIQQANLRNALLPISGAIQVLEENSPKPHSQSLRTESNRMGQEG